MKSKAEHRAQFDGVEYPIHVIGRHLSVTDAMKNYAVEKLSKVERFGGKVIDATIIMDVQKQTQTVEFILNVNRTKIKVSGKTRDMYASVDQALDRLKMKVTKYNDKLHHYHNKPLSVVDMHVNVVQGSLEDEINDQIEEANLEQIEGSLAPGHIVAQEKRPLKTLTKDESIMKMELSEDPFLVYRSEEDRKLKVIYRHEDRRNYGIIELPE